MLLRLLRKIDLFGHPVGLKYRGKHNNYQSAIGGFLTLVALAWVVLVVTYRVLELNGFKNVFF